MKRGISLLIFLSIFHTFINASGSFYILKNEAVILPKAMIKIDEVGNELKEKTSINLFLIAKSTINNQKITEFEKNIASTLIKPYILISFAKKEQKVDIITSSKKLDNIIDKDEILDDYIIPILVSYDKNSEISKSSASLLNGYIEIADRIAEDYNIELKSSIGSSNKIFSDVKRYIFYPILLIGLFLYLYSVYWRKK